jgi:hypothetical protein
MSEAVAAQTAQVTNSAVEAETKPAEVQKPEAQASASVPEAKPSEPSKDEPKSEAKPAEPAKPVAPEKYDLKLPEDSLLEAQHVDKIKALAKQNGLSNADAQALLDSEHNSVVTYIEEKKTVWLKQVTEDKEIGGDNLNRNVELAHRVLEKHGTAELKNELNRTGYGNHPELVRFLVRLGKASGEDQLVAANTQGSSKRSAE